LQNCVDRYLNRPDLTAAAWDEDGFYHTGDIGEMPAETHIKLIDRVKNIFKLLNGEWVSPENVEAVYTGQCPSIAQVCAAIPPRIRPTTSTLF
jgi:long-chain acyl-CoA synthetase